MKAIIVRFALGIALAGGLCASSVRAETTRTLPTLLIKGEVVSVDANDPSATLLKVKDRYGFETPIFVTPETKISQPGDAAQTISSLTAGTPVEVEYNFDINTAKRHAVSVKVVAQAPAAPEAPVAAAPAPTEAPASPEPAAAVQPAAPAETTPAPQAETPAVPAQE